MVTPVPAHPPVPEPGPPVQSIQSVQVVVSCPSCGATDYEFDLAVEELDCQVSVPCDECPQRISVEVQVRVQSLTR
jgi:hypothetical protein